MCIPTLNINHYKLRPDPDFVSSVVPDPDPRKKKIGSSSLDEAPDPDPSFTKIGIRSDPESRSYYASCKFFNFFHYFFKDSVHNCKKKKLTNLYIVTGFGCAYFFGSDQLILI